MSDSDRQPIDYKSIALPLRQSSLSGYGVYIEVCSSLHSLCTKSPPLYPPCFGLYITPIECLPQGIGRGGECCPRCFLTPNQDVCCWLTPRDGLGSSVEHDQPACDDSYTSILYPPIASDCAYVYLPQGSGTPSKIRTQIPWFWRPG